MIFRLQSEDVLVSRYIEHNIGFSQIDHGTRQKDNSNDRKSLLWHLLQCSLKVLNTYSWHWWKTSGLYKPVTIQVLNFYITESTLW